MTELHDSRQGHRYSQRESICPVCRREETAKQGRSTSLAISTSRDRTSASNSAPEVASVARNLHERSTRISVTVSVVKAARKQALVTRTDSRRRTGHWSWPAEQPARRATLEQMLNMCIGIIGRRAWPLHYWRTVSTHHCDDSQRAGSRVRASERSSRVQARSRGRSGRGRAPRGDLAKAALHGSEGRSNGRGHLHPAAVHQKFRL